MFNLTGEELGTLLTFTIFFTVGIVLILSSLDSFKACKEKIKEIIKNIKN